MYVGEVFGVFGSISHEVHDFSEVEVLAEIIGFVGHLINFNLNSMIKNTNDESNQEILLLDSEN